MFKRIIPLFIIIVAGCVLISCSERTMDDNIDETIVEKKGNYEKVSTPIDGVSQEKIIKLIKASEEYINKENIKNEKINRIKGNLYFEKLKKSNILRENDTIDTSKQFDAIKFIKDSNVVSNMIKDMSTKELIDNFSQMNDQDRVSAIVTIISRNEFKNEYANQLELANVSVLKEKSKNTKEIEEIEKSFNEWFNTKLKYEMNVAKQMRKNNLIFIAMIIAIAIWVTITIFL
ncbi:hypothetical protein ABDJ34_08130 [Finegoldia dalianensis]|uniref:Lipoprotein n=1 Tax=Finegoldia dalianensis TaxID=3145239 RepID=A0ABW9KFA1_9FIRM